MIVTPLPPIQAVMDAKLLNIRMYHGRAIASSGPRGLRPGGRGRGHMSISDIGAEDLEITLFGMELGVWKRDPRQKKTKRKTKREKAATSGQ